MHADSADIDGKHNVESPYGIVVQAVLHQRCCHKRKLLSLLLRHQVHCLGTRFMLLLGMHVAPGDACAVLTDLDGKHDIDGANDIVVLCVDGACSVDHGVGRAALLPKVDHSVWLEADKDILQELPVTDVAYLEVNVVA